MCINVTPKLSFALMSASHMNVSTKKKFSNSLKGNGYIFSGSNYPFSLTHCILVDSSAVICWTSPYVILGVSCLFGRFYSILMENPVSKQSRP